MEDQKLLLAMLDRLEDRFDRLEGKVDAARIDIATLKVKAALWGGSLGTLTGIAGAVIMKVLHG